MEFSFKASRIIEDTLNAINQADEIQGLEIVEYIAVMDFIANELRLRASVALNILLADEA